LFRDSNVFDQELFIVFMLEADLADVVLKVVGEGFRPWWQRTREVAALCPEGEKIEFGEPPAGFWADGGWWEDASGGIFPLRAQPTDVWTHAMTEAKLGTAEEVVSVVLPSGVSSISGDAFSGYAALRWLTIQPGCVQIGGKTIDPYLGDGTLGPGRWGAMAGCKSLVKVTMPRTCTSIGEYAFDGCSGLKELTIPSSVLDIGDSAFRGCSGLTELTFRSSLTNIGYQTFRGCSRLRAVAIPDSVTSIGQAAFYGCSALTQLTIPSSVTRIGPYAFAGCSSLMQLTISANTPRQGGWGHGVFARVTTVECVTLVGHQLERAVVVAVEDAVAPGAKIVSPALAGQHFGCFEIVAAP
jgi:hypothetical protein